MQMGDIGYEESETSDIGLGNSDAKSTFKASKQLENNSSYRDVLLGSGASRNITVNMPKDQTGADVIGRPGLKRENSGNVGVGSSEEDEEESDEVDFKDDQSLSDKLIASTDRLRYSPDQSLVSSTRKSSLLFGVVTVMKLLDFLKINGRKAILPIAC